MKTTIKTFLWSLGVASSLSAVAGDLTMTSTLAQSSPRVGIELENIDPEVRPQDDFYRYVNGKWLEKQKIPADKTNYGSFTQLADDAEANIKSIIEAAVKEKNPQGNQQKIAALYQSFMDEALIEKKGVAPLLAELAPIDKLSSTKELPAFYASYQKGGVTVPFAAFVYRDAKNSEKHVVYFSQSGLGLPDKAFYFRDDEKSKALLAAYEAYIARLFELAKFSEPKKRAAKVFALEKAIAEHHWDRVKMRDADLTYNAYSEKELKKLWPTFNWDSYLTSLGVAGQDKYVVTTPSYFENFAGVADKFSIDDWKNYHRFHTINAHASSLPKDFVQAEFDFYRKTLSGAKEMRQRWKKGVDLVNGLLGEAVGKIYVEKHFDARAKQEMEVLVANLLKAYEISIKELEWMSADTKKKALEKLSKFVTKIGYPNKWRDYSKFVVKADDLFGNTKRYAAYAYQRSLNKLGKPVDREEWYMSPQTVNAYYSPLSNEIVFPAAILQPPFFNVNADPAVNYGAIGAVIGHEIGHGFDDQGSKYDGNGNLNNWWSEADLTEFKARTGQLVKQYSQYKVLDNKLAVNGEFTLGENIGDLGGLSIAYKAYQLSLKGDEAPILAGLTGDQRFFMGWAQIWRRKYTEQELSKRITTDSHSPSEFRVIGVLSNMPEFYQAFGLKEGDKMFKAPEKRVKIW